MRSFADALTARSTEVDLLVNNVAASPRTREVTEDGPERHWATNVVGPHLLTRLLLPALEAGGGGRIVNISTRAAGGLDLDDTQFVHRRYSGVRAYRASKQAALMLTWALAERLAGCGVTANAVNPGYVASDLTMNTSGLLKVLVTLTRPWAVSALDGADTAIWLAASPEVQESPAASLPAAVRLAAGSPDPVAIQRLWDLVENQAQVTPRAAQS